MTDASPVRPAPRSDRAVSDWEHEIRARLESGDDAVLGEIYDQYASFVYGLALRVIGDARAAEDVSQDVFLFIWERPEAFDPDRGSLRTWLGTLTHRRSVDYVRREEARRRRTQRDASRRATQIPDVEEMATALVTAERVRNALRRAARRATPRDPARLLRGEDLPAGGRGARHPRGNREVAVAPRPAAHRGRPRRRRTGAMGMTPRFDDATLEELLGAYALDACEPDEAAAIEELLDRRPDLAIEARRMSNAAAWVGATGALAPPDSLRADVLGMARQQRHTSTVRPVSTASAVARTDRAIASFDEANADRPTPNGLRARRPGRAPSRRRRACSPSRSGSRWFPTSPRSGSRSAPRRSSTATARVRSPRRTTRLRRSVDAVRRWAEDPCDRHDRRVDPVCLASARTCWSRLRSRTGSTATTCAAPKVVPARRLQRPTARDGRPLGAARCRCRCPSSAAPRPDRVARVVLTGDGGGDWLIAMGGGHAPAGAVSDVTLTADVVDWCRRRRRAYRAPRAAFVHRRG